MGTDVPAAPRGTASHVFARDCRTVPPVAARGEGCWIVGADGRRWLDGSGGAAVSCLGHGDPDVGRAIREQLERLEFAHTGFFTSEPAEALAARLIERAPGRLDRAYLVSGGSEAVESAIKLARQYFVETGEASRTRLIARRQSYHGNTLGALAAGGNLARRETFAPLLADVSHVAPCSPWRDRRDDETPEAYGRRVADELDAEIVRLGPENVMAFVAEPVVGATAGALVPVEGYFRRIREICDARGVLLILDEVMCGTGRTGTLFACEQEGVAPDILCMAKGLGAGYQPLAAMLCTDRIHDAIARGSGAFRHGHTALGHPVACAAGLAVLDKIEREDLLARCRERGAHLDARLRDAFDDHPHVGEVRGRGLFVGVELVADRATKAPFEPGHGLHRRIKAHAFERGLICYPGGGTVDGVRGDHVLLAPPYTIDEGELDLLVERLGAAVDASVREIVRAARA